MQRWYHGLLCVVICLLAVVVSADEVPFSKMECAVNGGCLLNEDKKLRMLLIGDSGGLPIWPYYTRAQKKVRDTMRSYIDYKNVQIALNVGDNIYFVGVENEFDSRFQTSFENVYEDLDLTFFTIAGNHDHFGNVSAQIAYTKHSNKWMFPDYYYKLSWTLNDGTTIDVLMLDTVILCGGTSKADDPDSTIELVWYGSKEPDGPEDVEKAEEQWDWIAKNLNESTADYLFVSGHYPVYSIASHGPTTCLKDRLKPMLEKFGVSGYFAGHDHNLQHIFENGVNYFVSGAASRTDGSTAHKDDIPPESLKYHYSSTWNPFSQLGFTKGALIYIEVSTHGAFFMFLDGNGNIKYTTGIEPRKR